MSEVVQKLVALWDSSSSPPDVFAFLAEHEGLAADQLLPVLLTDQQRRWRTPSPLKVEDYLARMVHLAGDPKVKLQLAVGEFQARRDADTCPDINEYTSRFGDISDPLRKRLAELASGGSPPAVSAASTATFVFDSIVGAGQLGRYRLIRILGEGGFGRVYLAFDEELRRQVAIKVPTAERFQKPEDADAYLAEARTVASLNHPHIVPVFDMGRTDEGSVYVVSRYISGETLDDLIQRRRPSPDESARLVATLALALHYAHQRHLIHRDIKPKNILLEGDEAIPHVADFGLAIREDDYRRNHSLAGTPAYMSPEQARGESHRLDGRSDLFSLGVIFYELLTGQRPFHGSTTRELLQQVISAEPRSPRELDPSIPVELERICLKALSKRVSDRYASGAEFADELLHWNQTPEKQRTELTIVPKGLRSFEAEDAEFFLDLLPGPRNRSGLPESIQFWKTRIEETDPEKTFAVGLLYGPSGCGKSSLVKAGLLPRLATSVSAIYIEATPDDTELRILRALRKAVADLPPDLELSETFAWLRQRQGQKVVVVLDQFEQWLHAHGSEPEAELISALRQCDGRALQAIVMVRDDFAMAAARFMDSLDVPILQGQNFATVDLFDQDHARKVLVKFGQAFGKLSANSGNLSPLEKAFVEQVVAGLAQNGKVVSVQIALLAEMLRGKPWIAATLDEFGGTEGIGVSFLEDTFGSRSANPKHKQHQAAAREILRALLPEASTDIKGHMRSSQELLDSSSYRDRPERFLELLQILDNQLRLITPTDPEGDAFRDATSSDSSSTRYYQLTHDFLVPSLRDWLTRKQRETKQGHAELRLAERAAVWRINSEHKQLPTLFEWLRIRRWTDTRRWTPVERAMMQTAGRVHIRNWGGSAVIVLLLICVIGYAFEQQQVASQREQVRSALGLLPGLGPAIPLNIQVLKRLRKSLVLPELKSRYQSSNDPREKLSLAFALASYGEVDAAYLVSQIDVIRDEDIPNFMVALGEDSELSLTELKRAASACTGPTLWRRKARLGLASLAFGESSLPIDVCEFEGRTDQEPRTWFVDEFPRWKLGHRELVSTLENCPSPALRSAVCLGLGQIPVDQISVVDQRALSELAIGWYELPDSSTHSAAAWLLRQWELPEPQVQDAHQIVKGREWFVNSQGATMVLIEPTGDPSTGPTQPYWIANREVTRSEFEEFIKDESYDGVEPERREAEREAISPTSSHPATFMTWYETVEFCNWLSKKEGREPFYPEIGNEIINGGQFPKWEEQPLSDGYRLLRENEWEYACRAGTQTQWSPGNNEVLLAKYCQMYPNNSPEVCGKRLPNAWGIHDLHGNVWEWCWDSDQEYGSHRLFRGGCFARPAASCRSAVRFGYVPSYRRSDLGFRVALSSQSGIPLPPEAGQEE